jgi:hypothetical protein
MAGRESVLADRDPSIFEDDPAKFAAVTAAVTYATSTHTGPMYGWTVLPTPQPATTVTKPTPVAHAIVRASTWVWALAVLLSVTAGLVGIVAKSAPWCAVALVGAFIATFTVVARMSDGHDREAVKAAFIVAGAFLYVGILAGTATAVVMAGWLS